LAIGLLTRHVNKNELNNNNNNNNNTLQHMQGNRITIGQKQWYEHVPKSAETSQGGKVTILWKQQVQTDRTIHNNKPDIIIRDNGKETCMLIDVAISGGRNVI
jgi:hypothetical protein